MYKFRSFVFIIVLLILPFQKGLSAGGGGDKAREKALNRGIQAFYKADWQAARSIFDSIEEEYGKQPQVSFFRSMIPFWKYFFGGTQSEAAKAFLQQSEEAIKISVRHLKAHPADTTTVLLLSGLYGYRGLVAAGEHEYQTAIRSGLTGYRYTRQLLSIDSDNPNALIGKGILHYMLGSIPPGVRWMSNLAGMKGDTRLGLEELKQAAAADTYVSTDARMILTYLYNRDEQPEKALPYIRKLVEQYPQNSIFKYNYAQTLEKLHRPSEAEAAYRDVIRLDNPELNVLTLESRSRLRGLGKK